MTFESCHDPGCAIVAHVVLRPDPDVPIDPRWWTVVYACDDWVLLRGSAKCSYAYASAEKLEQLHGTDNVLWMSVA